MEFIEFLIIEEEGRGTTRYYTKGRQNDNNLNQQIQETHTNSGNIPESREIQYFEYFGNFNHKNMKPTYLCIFIL